MDRDELIERLWALHGVAERIHTLWGRRASPQVNAELLALRTQYAQLGGPELIPAAYVVPPAIVRIVTTIEQGRAETVLGAIRVLADDEHGRLDRAAARRSAAVAQRAAHQARMASAHATWVASTRLRWAIQDLRRP